MTTGDGFVLAGGVFVEGLAVESDPIFGQQLLRLNWLLLGLGSGAEECGKYQTQDHLEMLTHAIEIIERS